MSSAKEKFFEGLVEAIISDPEVIYSVIESVVTTLLGMLTVKDVLHALDNQITPEQVFAKVPEQLLAPIKERISKLPQAQKVHLKKLAQSYLNYKNVMTWLKQEDKELYAVVVNHPYGPTFVRQFISYVLENYLDKLLG